MHKNSRPTHPFAFVYSDSTVCLPREIDRKRSTGRIAARHNYAVAEIPKMDMASTIPKSIGMTFEKIKRITLDQYQ